MAETGWFNGTFEAMNRRLVEKGVASVLPGGWNLAEMPEKQESDPQRGKRPYAIVEPNAVRNQKFTNRTKYADLEFTFEIHADTFDELDGAICPKVTAALQHAANTVLSGAVVNVTMIRPGDIEFEKVEQIWTARMAFVIQANQPAASTVA